MAEMTEMSENHTAAPPSTAETQANNNDKGDAITRPLSGSVPGRQGGHRASRWRLIRFASCKS